jgi:hypothetical protein
MKDVGPHKFFRENLPLSLLWKTQSSISSVTYETQQQSWIELPYLRLYKFWWSLNLAPLHCFQPSSLVTANRDKNHTSPNQLTPFPCYCTDHSQVSLSLRDADCFGMRFFFFQTLTCFMSPQRVQCVFKENFHAFMMSIDFFGLWYFASYWNEIGIPIFICFNKCTFLNITLFQCQLLKH